MRLKSLPMTLASVVAGLSLFACADRAVSNDAGPVTDSGADASFDAGADAGVPDGGSVVRMVLIPAGQNVNVGATRALVVNAWDSSGNPVAVAPGDVTWGVIEGGDHLEFSNGQAVGLEHGKSKVFATVCGVPSPVQDVRVTVVPYGQLIPLLPDAGSLINAANAISSDGKVVVGSSTYSSETQAYSWTKGGQPQALGMLSGSDFCSANGVNSDGSAVVGYCSGDTIPTTAFIWTAQGGIKPLEGFPGYVSDAIARAVSTDGKIVVGSCFEGSDIELGFLWEKDAGVQIFGDLIPPGPRHDLGIYAITPDGQSFVGEIGYNLDTTGNPLYEAFVARQVDDKVWDMNLLTAPSQEDPLGRATAINSDGSIIVGQTGIKGPFKWSLQEGMVSISPMREINALALSDDGTIVAGGGADPGEAFLWDTTVGYKNLINLLIAYGLYDKDLESCSPASVTGISSDGQIMVGNCMKTGAFKGFYLELPN